MEYDEQLRMWLPGELVAPFDIDEYDTPARWTGDVETEQILGDNYANRVTVISDPKEEQFHEEGMVGDGTAVSDAETE